MPITFFSCESKKKMYMANKQGQGHWYQHMHSCSFNEWQCGLQTHGPKSFFDLIIFGLTLRKWELMRWVSVLKQTDWGSCKSSKKYAEVGVGRVETEASNFASITVDRQPVESTTGVMCIHRVVQGLEGGMYSFKLSQVYRSRVEESWPKEKCNSQSISMQV